MRLHLTYNELDVPNRKTKVVEVRGYKNFFLGTVEWHNHWRQYVFRPTAEPSLWSGDCLLELQGFVRALNDEHRDQRGSSP